VDLGCGSGRDTIELLRRRWQVLAIDSDDGAISRLREVAGSDPNLRLQLGTIEGATWEAVDLVNASLSLFFVPPAKFVPTWERIVASLKPGGRFCGQLLGDRGDWAPQPDMTRHSRDEAMRLLQGLEVELFEERHDPAARSARGEPMYLHGFDVVARKPR
jgi:tellurite methyltransferase